MATGTRGGRVVTDVMIDLKRFHEYWMGLVFPRQVGVEGTVLGKWQPSTRRERIGYQLWGAIGVPVIAILYPLVLVGTIIRFQSRRIDDIAGWLGILGVVVVSAVVWGLLAVVAQRRFPAEGFIAVVAAGVVATISAVGAVVFARIGGRGSTVLVAYPLGVTAIFLPPVVAALFSPTLADVVFPGSQSLAIGLLERMPERLATFLRNQFDLVGVAYVGMWFGLAVPLGWFLGTLVYLADVIRPTD